MSIKYPTDRNEVLTRMKTDAQNAAPVSNPFLKNSFFGVFLAAIAGRVFEFYYQLQKQLMPDLFPDTARTEFLERWGSYRNIIRNPATQASGYFTAIGTVGSNIPISSELQTSDGAVVKTLATAIIATNSASVSSLTRSAYTAYATTAADHGFATGMTITIAGATQTDYNGAWVVVVTGTNTFTYTLTATPATPATGTITASADMASIEVETVDYGQQANIEAGNTLTFSSPIAGVNDTGFVQYGGISGGTDVESDDDLRTRTLESYRNPVALFNDYAIIAKAKEVSGVTRVWVEDATPAPGQVTIYFVRDDDTPSIIPSPGEVTTTKNKILEIKPANTDDADVIVDGPTPVTVNFTFSALSPNTPGMQAAVTANLQQFFAEQTEVSTDLTAVAYQSAIFNTVDLESGDKLVSFTLSSPTTDITVATGELAVLGSITYP